MAISNPPPGVSVGGSNPVTQKYADVTNEGAGSAAARADHIHGMPDFLFFFGDGSDGDVTISGDTTLTRDMFYNNLTINNTKTLTPAGYRIFVKGILTNNGTLSWIGGAGANASGVTQGNGGTALTATFLGAGSAGGTGGNGASGANGANGVVGGARSTAWADKIGGTGGNGGVSASFATVHTGGAGGANTLVTGADLSWRHVIRLIEFKTRAEAVINCGSGGGGGAGGNSDGSGNSSGAGGGGGAGGGNITIIAKVIINNGTISARGGNGGNGANSVGGTSGGGGGGGGGGAGGNITLIYNNLSVEGTVLVTGGTKGTKGTKIGTGTDGSDGNDGAAGIYTKVPIS